MPQYLPEQTPKQCRQVNAFIKEQIGVDPDLVKGNGYFYFASLVGDCAETSVYVNSIGQCTFAEWQAEYQRLSETNI